jgi:DNA-binding NtrC family response regulator
VANRVEVLIVSTDIETCRALASVLSQWGLEPNCCSTVSEAVEFIAAQPLPLIFCEDHLPDGSFRDILRAAKAAITKIRVVVTTRNGCRSEAFRLGAFNVISCPCHSADVQDTVFLAMQRVHSAALA